MRKISDMDKPNAKCYFSKPIVLRICYMTWYKQIAISIYFILFSDITFYVYTIDIDIADTLVATEE